MTLTFDLEHLQCIACDVKLCTKWTQSSNPRRSYCDFNIWPVRWPNNAELSYPAVTVDQECEQLPRVSEPHCLGHSKSKKSLKHNESFKIIYQAFAQTP